MRTRLATALIVITLNGCAGGFSGLGGSSQYGCQAPKGSACTSISGVYANGPQGARAPVTSGTKHAATARTATTTGTANPNNAPPATEPLRTTPRVLRLWIAPWEDSDGDLHEASTLHVLIDTGRWRMPHGRPVRPPVQDVKAPAPAIEPKPSSANGTPVAPHR